MNNKYNKRVYAGYYKRYDGKLIYVITIAKDELSGEDFEIVQELTKKIKRRAPKAENGEKSMFSDLLYCADCGSKLWYHTNTNNKDIHYFSCSNYKKDTRGDCESRHYIRAGAVEQVVMLELV